MPEPKEIELWVVVRHMAMQQRCVIVKTFVREKDAIKFRQQHGKSGRCKVVRFIPDANYIDQSRTY